MRIAHGCAVSTLNAGDDPIPLVFGAADFRPVSLSSMIRSEHKLRLRILMEFAIRELTTNVFAGKRASKQIDPP